MGNLRGGQVLANPSNHLSIALLHVLSQEPTHLRCLQLRQLPLQYLFLFTQHSQQQLLQNPTLLSPPKPDHFCCMSNYSSSKYDYFDYQKMRRRTNSLSVKVKALESIKKISEECYDLTSPAISTPCKPLLCQAELFSRTTPQIQGSPAYYHRSAPISHTARSIQPDKRLVSAFDIGSPLTATTQSIQTEHFCKRVYTTKLIQTQAKENSRQKTIFIKKLTKAVEGDVLNATGYDLGPLGVREICDYLLKNRIQDLILDRNNFRDEGVLEVAKVIARLRLRVLSLASVSMTEKGCKALLAQLTTMETLDQLNISSYEGFNRNKLHKDAFEGIGHLIGAGAGKTNLKILKCGGVGLDDNNFRFLCQGLGRGSRLEHLSIEDNEISSQGMGYFKEHAVKLHLKYFDCSSNKIEGGGLNEISSLIGIDYNLTKISKALKTLKINKGKIRSGPLALFSKSMANNQTLEDLSLDGNPLGQGGKFNIFSNFIARNWTIKRLSLCQSLRSTDEVMMLCDSLESSRGLEVLMISRNNLQFCAFKKLLEMLSRNKSIKKLHIQACGIVDSFVTKAQEAVMQLKYLQQLYLDHNYLNDNAGRVLQKCIFKNKMLSKVQLHNNSIGVKMQKMIDRALSYNIETKKFDGPDLSYYKYVEEIQTHQKNNLHQVIQQLKTKENQLNCRQLLHNIAKKQQESTKKATEIKKEAVEVEKIVEIQNNLKKINELEKKAQMNRINDSLANDSNVSFSELQVPGIGRGVSIQMENSSFISEVSSNLSQTH